VGEGIDGPYLNRGSRCWRKQVGWTSSKYKGPRWESWTVREVLAGPCEKNGKRDGDMGRGRGVKQPDDTRNGVEKKTQRGSHDMGGTKEKEGEGIGNTKGEPVPTPLMKICERIRATCGAVAGGLGSTQRIGFEQGETGGVSKNRGNVQKHS